MLLLSIKAMVVSIKAVGQLRVGTRSDHLWIRRLSDSRRRPVGKVFFRCQVEVGSGLDALVFLG